MQEKELRNYIQRLIEEVEDEDVDESTSTGNISGYQTPHAFSVDGEEDEDHIDSVIKSSGYTRAKNENKFDNLNEELSNEDEDTIRDIVRSEVSAIFFDLFKKRRVWGA